MRSRQATNRKILALLDKLITLHPQLRFSQILAVYGFVEGSHDVESGWTWKDEFYTEPDEILNRVRNLIKE